MLNQQLVYLTQTDTTVGFLSQNSEKLSASKQRDNSQAFIKCVDSLNTLQQFTRVPRKYKNFVRRSSRITIVYPNNQAIRVVKDENHLKFLSKFKWFYSSSANKTKKNFDEKYAKEKADIIVEDKRGLFEGQASVMIKINNASARRLR